MVPDNTQTGEAKSPIQGGSLDLSDNAVVGVLISLPAASLRKTCSGTLIAPYLVLTAQHCVATTSPFVNCASSTFGTVSDPADVTITTGASMWREETEWIPAAEILLPPGGNAVCGRDVALIRLSRAVDEEKATPLSPNLHRDVQPDESYSAIGYGTSGEGTHDGGIRRRREKLHVVCVGDSCGTSQVGSPEWRGDHGICSGDSGGPAVDEEGSIIGVTSRGPMGCDSPIYGGLAAHREWIMSEALRAASALGASTPHWADPPEDPPSLSSSTLGAPGCVASRVPPEGDIAPLATIGALVLARVLRRPFRRRAVG